jgi:hypothetical protein
MGCVSSSNEHHGSTGAPHRYIHQDLELEVTTEPPTGLVSSNGDAWAAEERRRWARVDRAMQAAETASDGDPVAEPGNCLRWLWETQVVARGRAKYNITADVNQFQPDATSEAEMAASAALVTQWMFHDCQHYYEGCVFEQSAAATGPERHVGPSNTSHGRSALRMNDLPLDAPADSTASPQLISPSSHANSEVTLLVLQSSNSYPDALSPTTGLGTPAGVWSSVPGGLWSESTTSDRQSPDSNDDDCSEEPEHPVVERAAALPSPPPSVRCFFGLHAVDLPVMPRMLNGRRYPLHHQVLVAHQALLAKEAQTRSIPVDYWRV